VSDALDKLKLTGVVSGLPQRSGTGRIAGRVITVKLGVGEPPPGPPVHLCCTAIEQANSDHVIVVEQRTGVEAGCWGGLLSLAAKVRGVVGVVADGPVRDIDEAVLYEFPIFSRAVTARTARGRVVEKGTNIPIQVDSVTVQPGDYVLADGSAVIFISESHIETVLVTAEAIVAKEAFMAKSLLSGTPASEVMGGNYEHMLK
jgi:regulator of RNase E activity RraA